MSVIIFILLCVCVASSPLGTAKRGGAALMLVVLLLTGCKSSRDVVEYDKMSRIERRVGTLLTLPGDTSRVIAQVRVEGGHPELHDVCRKEGDVRVDVRLDDDGHLHIEAISPTREVPVQVEEIVTEVERSRHEEVRQDSRVVSVVPVVVIVAVITLIIAIKRWMKL